jgi:hypothetical protein
LALLCQDIYGGEEPPCAEGLKKELVSLLGEIDTSSPVDLPVNFGKWIDRIRKLSTSK